jgi:hypothetical protein
MDIEKNWNKKFGIFKPMTNWKYGKNLGKGKKIYNQVRDVLIEDKFYLEVKVSTRTFICDIKNYDIVKKYRWTCGNKNNKYYVKTNIKRTSKYFHQFIKPNNGSIIFLNNESLDLCECNLK